MQSFYFITSNIQYVQLKMFDSRIYMYVYRYKVDTEWKEKTNDCFILKSELLLYV